VAHPGCAWTERPYIREHAGWAPYHPRRVQVEATNPNRHCPSVLVRVKGSRARKLARRRNAALDTACAR
jgi:hypothetical protein